MLYRVYLAISEILTHSWDEISKVIKILKPNKSPGEDAIISEFYQQDIKEIKFEYTLRASQYKGVLTLLHMVWGTGR